MILKNQPAFLDASSLKGHIPQNSSRQALMWHTRSKQAHPTIWLKIKSPRFYL